MEYKSKYTASEIDARLSQVFDSTLQTKEVEVALRVRWSILM